MTYWVAYCYGAYGVDCEADKESLNLASAILVFILSSIVVILAVRLTANHYIITSSSDIITNNGDILSD